MKEFFKAIKKTMTKRDLAFIIIASVWLIIDLAVVFMCPTIELIKDYGLVVNTIFIILMTIELIVEFSFKEFRNWLNTNLFKDE